MKIFSLAILLALSFSSKSFAELKKELVEYRHGDAILEGYLVYDDSLTGKRPGVLIVHEWTGINENVRNHADAVAKLGFVAFAADMYGKGVRPKNTEEASAQSSIYRSDRPLMRARVAAALGVLKDHSLVEAERVAAIGYCFGGGTVLELARSGADIRGAVSFHGNLDTPTPADAKNIKAKILVLHGADDPYVPAEQVSAFLKEMREGEADFQIICYGGAVHSFTNPFSGSDASKGAAYNESADKRSWEAMKAFFAEIFADASASLSSPQAEKK